MASWTGTRCTLRSGVSYSKRDFQVRPSACLHPCAPSREAGEPSQRFQVDQLHVHGDPDAHLPTSSTCFFSLHWPAYTTAAAAKEKLLYALYNCRDMDLN